MLAGLGDEKKRKILEARALIKAGMGTVDDSPPLNKFGVVEEDIPLPSLDDEREACTTNSTKKRSIADRICMHYFISRSIGCLFTNEYTHHNKS